MSNYRHSFGAVVVCVVVVEMSADINKVYLFVVCCWFVARRSQLGMFA